MAFNNLSLLERLNRQILIVGGCHIFQGTKDARGYGMIRVNGKYKKAHRESYAIHKGEIPQGFVIMHSCDTPSCVNPEHLTAAPQAENVRDMHQKGRAVFIRGEDHLKSKLTQPQVDEIRKRYTRYCRNNGSGALAKEFGVSSAAILAIIEWKSWK